MIYRCQLDENNTDWLDFPYYPEKTNKFGEKGLYEIKSHYYGKNFTQTYYLTKRQLLKLKNQLEKILEANNGI
jgi:hypothetical protein